MHIVYEQNGNFYMTDESNYKAVILNKNKVTNINGVNSIDEAIQVINKWCPNIEVKGELWNIRQY